VSLKSFGTPISDSLANINKRFSSGELSEELFARGAQVRSLLVAEFAEQIKALNLPQQIQRDTVPGGSAPEPPFGFVSMGPGTPFFVWIRTEWPVPASVTSYYGVFVKSAPGNGADFEVVNSSGGSLGMWMRELSPTTSETVTMKVRGWVEGELQAIIADFSRQL
jgi:hypothetical protein